MYSAIVVLALCGYATAVPLVSYAAPVGVLNTGASSQFRSQDVSDSMVLFITVYIFGRLFRTLETMLSATMKITPPVVPSDESRVVPAFRSAHTVSEMLTDVLELSTMSLTPPVSELTSRPTNPESSQRTPLMC